MKISPIRFSQTLPLKAEIESKNKDNKTTDKPNITDFPLGYGLTNIAFCGKKTAKKKFAKNHKKTGMLETFQKSYATRMNPQNESTPEYLPILSKYVPPLLDTVKFLLAKGSCIVIHDKDIDSKEVFVKNLRTYIDDGRVRHLGFEKGKPFIDINLADYAESPDCAYTDMVKDINKQIKKGQTPVLMVSGIRALFEKIDRPNDFASNSIFKKYPTIFFVEQGYEVLDTEEATNLKLGFETRTERLNHPETTFFSEGAFHQTLSKISFVNHHPRVELPSLNSDDVYTYLTDNNVKNQLLTDGLDIEFNDEAIPFAIALSKVMKYHEDDYFNSRSKHRLLGTDTIPLNKTIELLRYAVIKKLMTNSMAKEVTDKDIQTALPSEIDWKKQTEDFHKAHTRLISNHQKTIESYKNLEAKTIKVTPPKTETPPTEEPPAQEVTESNNEEKPSNYEIIKDVKTKFKDVGGLYNIKKELQDDFLDILRNPRIKKSDIPSGILLSGPPGCGKTLLARAIAGEAGVPLISMPGSSFIEKWVGIGAKRVRELYNTAREEAKNHPSKTAIVFIDEVDAVAGSREKDGGTSEDSRTVAALLHELDGINNKEENNVKIITIVATNDKGLIDDAFKRSGRMDLKLEIPDPKYSVKAREDILKIHAKDLPFKNSESKNKLIHSLAQTTSGLSGADLVELLKKAHRMSLNVKRKNNYITADDIQEAKMRVLAGTKTDIEHTEFEIKQTVTHEAGHAVNSMILEKIFENEPNKHKMPTSILDFITNSARGGALGATYFKPSEENKMGSKESCLADLIVLYGGYAVEKDMFDTHSAGVSSDIQRASEIVENAVTKYDFGSDKHYMSLTSKLTSNLFQDEIKQDMKKFADKGMSLSKKLIKFAKPFIEYYVQNFFKKGIDLDKIISSDEFKSKFNEWLRKNNKKDEFKILCAEVKKEINEFCNEDDKIRIPVGFHSNN